MKILHLLDTLDFADGCGRHVLLLAASQQESGHAVMIAVGKGNAFGLCTEKGVPHIVIPEIAHAHRSAGRFLKGMKRLIKVNRNFRPDIIHCHHYYCAHQIKPYSRLAGIPLVLSVHSNLAPVGRLPQYIGDWIIAVSEATRTLVLQRSPQYAGRISLIRYAPQFIGMTGELLAGDAWSRLLALRSDRFCVAFVGRMAENKGLSALIDSLALVQERIPVVLAIAGSGPLEDSLRSRARERGVESVWFGAVPDVEPILQQADIVVVPSLRWEGLPIVLLEAGLAGKPVVASATDGIPELIENGVTGFLVKPGDVAGLSDAIQAAHADVGMRERIAYELHRRVLEQYSPERLAREIEAVYNTVLPARISR